MIVNDYLHGVAGLMLPPTAGWPSPWPMLFFALFSTWVVHVSNRLVEHTAWSVDPGNRRLSASYAALIIGCIVWALDIGGLFMYRHLDALAPSLHDGLLALLVMIASARFTIPELSSSVSRRRTAVAGALLALGMLSGHFVLAMSYGASLHHVEIGPLLASIVLAVALTVVLAIRHRAAKQRLLNGSRVMQRWPDIVLGGVTILALHCLLINAFPPAAVAVTPGGQAGAIGVVTLFAVVVALEHMGNLRLDQRLQLRLRQGLSMMRVATPAVTPQHDVQMALIADHLPELLTPQRLVLHYQPIVQLETDQAPAFEALLRLQHPVLGRLNPEVFLLVCELQGRTARVDRLILEQAIRQMADWERAGQPGLRVSVNLSPTTLMEPDFNEWLAQRLANHGVGAWQLTLELTEHAIIASGTPMLEAMRALAGVGIAVVMDDFGAGYSSLGMLAELPIRGIKCDRLFVRKLLTDSRRQRLLSHVLAIARDFDLEVTAEGIETSEELDMVREIGLRKLQGYLFAKAMPAEEVPGWLRLLASGLPQLKEKTVLADLAPQPG
ncbi:MAG: EAL domain-containing protein [Curvibacter sp.]|nr:MAG: EAL domain-containing protein [Curvibacter sp.]